MTFKTLDDILKPYKTRDADWVNGIEIGSSITALEI